MSNYFVQRCVSALLAATYLVVGATGDGLYYLFESPAISVASEGETSQGLFHDHGDGLWHHHRHGRAADSKQPLREESLADRDAGDLLEGGDSPREHTTLLLAIASAIEQSAPSSLPLSEAPQAESLIDSASSGHSSDSERASLGPRGPPANGLA